jgi:hypothetical protein
MKFTSGLFCSILIVAISTSIAEASRQKAPTLWGNLKPGRHNVGLRVITSFDKTRGASQEKDGRPVEITLWYPSRQASDASLTFADYFKLIYQEPVQEGVLRQELAKAISGDEKSIDQATIDRILSAQMLASLDTRPATGRYPLVLWSARHSTMAAQSVMCEYLASQGYVVAFARYKGSPLPLPYESKSDEEKSSTLDTHVRDMEFALTELRKLSNVMADSVAVLSWSYAGESATEFQRRNKAVRLVIGLSTNLLSNWVYRPSALSSLDAAQLRVPYVLISERIGTNGAAKTAPAILKDMRAGSFYITFNNLAHGSFNALEGMIPAVMGITKVQPWSKAGSESKIGYETACQYSLRFLDAYLKTKSDPLKNWAWREGLPEGFVMIDRYGQK